ncbi:hypothetical protein QFC19_008856 [Naganishia cerealis]|uniref:Uncharacterized protein n=1 Tax=Naganishia cerealis TaxID=610337 RepID=A0ACC2V042_9TREE|nr:hypothetical protein QFC19_008856 [Naganishia cerealis]
MYGSSTTSHDRETESLGLATLLFTGSFSPPTASFATSANTNQWNPPLTVNLRDLECQTHVVALWNPLQQPVQGLTSPSEDLPPDLQSPMSPDFRFIPSESDMSGCSRVTYSTIDWSSPDGLPSRPPTVLAPWYDAQVRAADNGSIPTTKAGSEHSQYTMQEATSAIACVPNTEHKIAKLRERLKRRKASGYHIIKDPTAENQWSIKACIRIPQIVITMYEESTKRDVCKDSIRPVVNFRRSLKGISAGKDFNEFVLQDRQFNKYFDDLKREFSSDLSEFLKKAIEAKFKPEWQASVSPSSGNPQCSIANSFQEQQPQQQHQGKYTPREDESLYTLDQLSPTLSASSAVFSTNSPGFSVIDRSKVASSDEHSGGRQRKCKHPLKVVGEGRNGVSWSIASWITPYTSGRGRNASFNFFLQQTNDKSVWFSSRREGWVRLLEEDDFGDFVFPPRDRKFDRFAKGTKLQWNDISFLKDQIKAYSELAKPESTIWKDYIVTHNEGVKRLGGSAYTSTSKLAREKSREKATGRSEGT